MGVPYNNYSTMGPKNPILIIKAPTRGFLERRQLAVQQHARLRRVCPDFRLSQVQTLQDPYNPKPNLFTLHVLRPKS